MEEQHRLEDIRLWEWEADMLVALMNGAGIPVEKWWILDDFVCGTSSFGIKYQDGASSE